MPRTRVAQIACSNLAEYLGSLGRNDEALDLARKAVILGPRECLSHNTLGECLLRTASRPGAPPGQLEEGIRELRTAVELNSSFADARVNLAMALMGTGQTDEARAQLTAALEAEPHHADAHQVLGELLAAQGDFRGAADEFARATALRPGSPGR